MEYRLLEKTELWVSPVRLNGADLGACAAAVGKVLELHPAEIMVTDVFEDRLTLDVLVPTVRGEQIIAREKAVLEALALIPGVEITRRTRVHSEGILGLVSLEEPEGREVIERSRAMGEQIAERIRKRSIVFPTGHEVLDQQIRDTNTPFLLAALKTEGYQAVQGPTLEDRAESIARAFRRAAEAGYGLVVTTGGIGAEGKDQTLEALTKVDPHACTPYVLKFKKGRGRHQKDGVRIGVGQLTWTRIVCLPGPHDEVRLLWPVLREGLQDNAGTAALAAELAGALRLKFLAGGRIPESDRKDVCQEVVDGAEQDRDLSGC